MTPAPVTPAIGPPRVFLAGVGEQMTEVGGEVAQATQSTRQTIAFYASTPSYTKVLDLHGWGGIHEELNSMSKRASGRKWGY